MYNIVYFFMDVKRWYDEETVSSDWKRWKYGCGEECFVFLGQWGKDVKM